MSIYHKYISLFANADPKSRHKGICGFLIRTDRDGVETGKHIEKMGHRCSNTTVVNLKDYRVPPEDVLAVLMEKSIIENSLNTQRDTFFVFDPSSGKPIKWNSAFRDITGITNEEISKLKAPDSYHAEEDLQKIPEAVN